MAGPRRDLGEGGRSKGRLRVGVGAVRVRGGVSIQSVKAHPHHWDPRSLCSKSVTVSGKGDTDLVCQWVSLGSKPHRLTTVKGSSETV